MGIGEYLKSHCLLTDGAMGTYYAEIKRQESPVSEWANIREPEVVAGIHRAYLEAGAMLLRTNTFAAGRQVLGVDKKGQEEIVRAACRIAKAEIALHMEKTGRKCFLAGDIGPLREVFVNGDAADVGEEYRALVDLFLEEGVDALWGGVAGRRSNGIHYTPVNSGPLKRNIAETFAGGSYTKIVLKDDAVFYRVYGGDAGKVGRYMTRTPQNGGMQTQIDLALVPDWGNTAEYITKVVVPKGTIIYEGRAALQAINGGAGQLLGGGNQIYIPEVNPLWFVN